MATEAGPSGRDKFTSCRSSPDSASAGAAKGTHDERVTHAIEAAEVGNNEGIADGHSQVQHEKDPEAVVQYIVRSA